MFVLRNPDNGELLSAQIDVNVLYDINSPEGGRGYPTRYTLSAESLKMSEIQKSISKDRRHRRNCAAGWRSSATIYTMKLMLTAGDFKMILIDADQLGVHNGMGSVLRALDRSRMAVQTMIDGSAAVTIQPLTEDLRPFQVSALLPKEGVVVFCNP